MGPVSVKIPVGSEYVMIARLAASGFCSRIGFDIDKTEDIKVTISEILNRCIVNNEKISSSIELEFCANQIFFTINFRLVNIKEIMNSSDIDDFGFSIIKALADGFEFKNEDELILKFGIKENP
jgi:hypothetical protein